MNLLQPKKKTKSKHWSFDSLFLACETPVSKVFFSVLSFFRRRIFLLLFWSYFFYYGKNIHLEMWNFLTICHLNFLRQQCSEETNIVKGNSNWKKHSHLQIYFICHFKFLVISAHCPNNQLILSLFPSTYPKSKHWGFDLFCFVLDCFCFFLLI